MCGSAVGSCPRTLFVVEHNAPWMVGPRAPNVRHIVFRADRLGGVGSQEFWLCDQVLIREEVGPPLEPGGYVLWLGRIHRDKGLQSVITFATCLPDTKVIVAGPSHDAEPDWPANVRRIGETGGTRKRELLCAADAFLYTVSPDWLGAGEGTLAEAAACGIPILAQTYGRACPVVRCVMDGYNGYRHHDAGTLARLFPAVRRLDRKELHDVMWARLDPATVIRDRLERIQRAHSSLQASAVSDQ